MKPSHTAALQKKTRRNLIHTLEDFADRERQLGYKQAVASVHVPQELLAQWGPYAALLKERPEWFLQSLTEAELEAMTTFDSAVAAVVAGNALPDVPEVFEVPRWSQLMKRARQLRAVLAVKEAESTYRGPAPSGA